MIHSDDVADIPQRYNYFTPKPQVSLQHLCSCFSVFAFKKGFPATAVDLRPWRENAQGLERVVMNAHKLQKEGTQTG